MIISCWNCGKKKGLLDNVCRNCGASYQYPPHPREQSQQQTSAWTNTSQTVSSSTGGRVLRADQHDVTLGTDILSRNSVSLPDQDRPYGTVLLGQTGFGKTSVLEQAIIAELNDEFGTTAFVFDPHGELTERLLRLTPEWARQYLLICEITGDLSYGFNPLEVEDSNDPMEVSRTVDSLLQVFRRHWRSNSTY